MKDSENGRERRVSKRIDGFVTRVFWGMIKAPFKALWNLIRGKDETTEN